MPTIVVVSLRKVTDIENIRAFATIELDFGEGCRITLYGLKLVKSKKDESMFLGRPQRENDGKWYDHYYPSPALNTGMLEAITKAYNK